MAKIKQYIEELRAKDQKTLTAELVKMQIALQKARVDMAFSRLKDNSSIDKTRKQIARLKTVMAEKEIHYD